MWRWTCTVADTRQEETENDKIKEKEEMKLE